MREHSFYTNFLKNPTSSVLSVSGNTKVIISLTYEKKVPSHVQSDGGWLTAEYSLMPGSTTSRVARERTKISGRTAEIQRLIGRSLRMSLNLKNMTGTTLMIDCDVMEADGGTRTCSINGGMVAVAYACRKLYQEGVFNNNPLANWVGAVSGGIIDGKVIVDLDYKNDSSADSDFNFVFCENGNIIEIQGTAEKKPVEEKKFIELLNLSREFVLENIKKMKIAAGYQL